MVPSILAPLCNKMVAFKPKNASAIKNIKIKDGKKRETVREKGNNNKNLWLGAPSNAYVISFKIKCFIDYHSNFMPDFSLCVFLLSFLIYSTRHLNPLVDC